MIGLETRPPGFARLAWHWWNALQLAFTIAWTACWICLAQTVLALSGGNRRAPLRMASRLWAPGLLIGAGAKLQVAGLERVDFSKPHVFVASHQSRNHHRAHR
ncbi:MAG TPA: hypothetical protein VJL61_12465 [Rhodanobacteraceae bacterium]|nr:hypothetical protein [Rhodanobacteraceae bacterium]